MLGLYGSNGGFMARLDSTLASVIFSFLFRCSPHHRHPYSSTATRFYSSFLERRNWKLSEARSRGLAVAGKPAGEASTKKPDATGRIRELRPIHLPVNYERHTMRQLYRLFNAPTGDLSPADRPK